MQSVLRHISTSLVHEGDCASVYRIRQEGEILPNPTGYYSFDLHLNDT